MAIPVRNVSAFSLADFFVRTFQGKVIDVVYAATPIPTPPVPIDLKSYVASEAKRWGVNVEMALFIAQHESTFDPTRVGDASTSYGMWQIHLPAHPDVTIASAQDPIWSTQWAMAHMTTPNIWSTWRYRCKWFQYQCREFIANTK